jgi:uncharacterized protein YqgC (DUF456 family)
MTGLEIIVAAVIAIGLAGVLLPVLPGTLLGGAAIVLWAAERGGAAAWLVCAVALVLLVAGSVVKYLVPGVVGFFVVPVVGLPLGFVLGVYLVEWQRLGHRAAGPATVHALRAVGLGIVIELTFGVLAAATWVLGVVLT